MAEPDETEAPAELPEVAEGETPPVDAPYFRAFVPRAKREPDPEPTV